MKISKNRLEEQELKEIICTERTANKDCLNECASGIFCKNVIKKN